MPFDKTNPHEVRADWKPCTKIKYTELGARMALDKIIAKCARHKHLRKKRKETSSYFCKECQAYHLSHHKR